MAEDNETTTQNAGGGVTTTDPGDKVDDAEKKTGRGVGGGGEDSETQLTILTAREMEWFFDRSSGKWYVSYGLPQSDRKLLFEATPDQMDALFGEGQRPSDFEFRRLEALTRDQDTTFGGNVAEMEGEGSFESEVRRVKALALDNGVLPEWAKKTGEIMDIIYIAQAEGKSNEWTLDQISRTNEFNERFPNIQEFRSQGNLTLEEAVSGFLEYEAGVKAAVNAIGRNPGAVTPDTIGALLGQGHSLGTIQKTTQMFDRMKQYRPAIQAFNRVLESQGMEPIRTLQDMFDFVSGNSASDVYDIYEASSVSEAAAAAGLGDIFSAEDAMNFALQTEGSTTLADATGAFSEAANFLLRLRTEIDFGRYGLNQEDIIDLSLGVPPRSGVSGADLQEAMNRAILSAQKSLGSGSKPFTGFTQEGKAQSASLGALRSG